MGSHTTSPTRTLISAKPAEELVLSAHSCGRNVETALVISRILTSASLAFSGDKGCRVGCDVNTFRLIRDRVNEHLLRRVIFILQRRISTYPLRRRRHQCRLPRQDHLAREPPHLRRRRHQQRVPRELHLAHEPLRRSSL